jgi:hypothetical protein
MRQHRTRRRHWFFALAFLMASAVGGEELPSAPETGEDPFLLHCRWAIVADYSRKDYRTPWAERSADGTVVTVIFDRAPAADRTDLGEATCTYPAPPDFSAHEAHAIALDGKAIEGIDRVLATKSALNAMIVAQLVEWPDAEWVQDPKYVTAEAQRRRDEARKRAQDAAEYSPGRLLTLARERMAAGDATAASRLVTLLGKLHPASAEAAQAAELGGSARAAAPRQQARESARRAEVVRELVEREDAVAGVTWYHAKGFPAATRTNDIVLYLGRFVGNTTLRLRINYHGEDWLFLQYFTILADGERVVIPAPPDSVSRDNADGHVWEWFDAKVEDPDLWRRIASAQEVTLRLHGRQYHSDRAISRKEKEAMLVVLDAMPIVAERMDE